MKKIVTLFLAAFLCIFANAQQPQFEWAKRFGGMGADGGMSIALDNDGYIYTAGYMSDTLDFQIGSDTLQLVSADGSADIIVTKQDADGNFIWAKQMGGPMASQANYIVVDGLGSLVITGTFSGTTDFDPGPGVFEMTATYSDIFIASLTSDGEFLWAKQIGSEYNDNGQTLAIDPVDGSILVTGFYTSTADFDPGPGVFELTTSFIGNYDLFLLKLDANGNFTWAIKIGADAFDFGMGVAVNNNSEIYLNGLFGLIVDFDPGAGIYEMESSYGSGYGDGFVCKLGPDGRFQWARQFGAESDDWAYSIAVDDNGNCYTTGMFNGYVDFDPGAGQTFLTSEGWDAFIWKLDTDGNLVWARNIVTGPAEAWGNAITLDNQGNPYVTGFFSETADFNPGDGVYNLTAGAHWEIFISKLNTSGDFAWAVAMGGNQWYDVNTQQGFGIAVDDDYNVYSTGTFESFTDFDPGPEIFYLQAELILQTMFYYEDAYVHKMSQDSTTVGVSNNPIIRNSFSLYPNPVKDNLTIDLKASYEQVEARLLDITGKLISTESFRNTSLINLRMDVKPGIYIIQLNDAKGMNVHFKVVKD